MKRTQRKPRVAIVGAGSLGRVLALAFHSRGYDVSEIIVRDTPASLRRARRFSGKVGARIVTLGTPITAKIIWMAVPDDAINDVAQQLSTSGGWKNKVVVHTSGALESSVLAPLKHRGAAVGSAHPLNTFVARSTAKDLADITFALEGAPAAVRAARSAVRAFGATSFIIPAERKPAYHVTGSLASPLLVSLLAAAEEWGRLVGLKDPRRAIEPIVRATMENFFRTGAAGAFSGPIKRGDVRTLQRHLQALKRSPRIREVYGALSRNALGTLPAGRAVESKRLFARRVLPGEDVT